MRKTAYLLTIILLLSLVVASQPATRPADGWVMDKVNGDQNDTVIEFFPGGGEDDFTTISLPADVPVYDARIGVKGEPNDNGKYPANIWMDVGKDGDFDWMYWGQGYGALGKQTRFLTNDTGEILSFLGNSVNDTHRIRIPAGAKVTTATMDVTGRAGVNNGVVIKMPSSTQCRMYTYSSNSAYDPKLVINYTDATSTTLQPDEAQAMDSMIMAQQPSTNYGSGNYLTYWSAQDARALIQYDLSSVNATKPISAATLWVAPWWSGLANQDWAVHEVLGSWSEATVTWNNQPTFNAVAEDSYNVYYQGQGIASGKPWMDWNITLLVAKWVGALPTNVTVDLGGDGDKEFKMTGEMDYRETTEDFSDKLNDYLSSASPTYTDKYGNKFIDVPVKAASETTGSLSISNISIEYDWTATVFKNPKNFNLTNELNQLMLDIPPVAGMVNMPLNIHTETAGKLRIKDVNVTYNGGPKIITPPPSNLSLDEDTAVSHFMDLSLYFNDDFLPSTMLDYEVFENMKKEKVVVDVVDTHYLYVDSSTVAALNYNGQFTVKVRATDELGFSVETAPITITVNPVNDEPVRGEEEIPDRSLSEGGSSQAVDLDASDFFYDVEGDPLVFTAEIDPAATFEGENITVEIFNTTNEMVVWANGDFFGDDIPVRIHCDDNVGGPSGAYQDILVTVVNQNDDPPVWSPIQAVHVPEDGKTEDAFRLADHVWDVDNEFSELRFAVRSISNSSAVSVKIDDAKGVDVKAIGDNWTGTVDVSLKATDDGENSAETYFEVIVDPINDLPLVSLVSPARGAEVTSGTVVLEWSAVDAETPVDELTYNIYMGEGAAETLLAEGVTGTSYTAAVDDGRMYQWTVSAGDGTGFGDKAKERAFSVDFGSGPRVTLVAPLDGAVVSTDSAQLTWSLEERLSGTGGTVTYDVFMALKGNDPGLAASGVTGTSWVATGLLNGKTYEWNVVPWDGLGRGTCVSGEWTLSVDMAFSGYGVDLTAVPTALTMAPGTNGALTLTLTNTGGADDHYRLSASLPEIPGTRIEFTGVDAGSIPIAPGEQTPSTLTLLVPGSTASGTYTLTITALSLMGGLESNVSVTVNIVSIDDIPVEPVDVDAGTSDDKGGLFGSGSEASTLALILIIIVVLMAVLMMFVSYKYRKKSDRVSELEGRRRLEPASMVDAELAFSPEGQGLAAAAGGIPASQQLHMGGAGAGAAAAAAPVPLALPKVATGGSSPAGGAAAPKDVTGTGTPAGPAAAPKPAGAPGPAPSPGAPASAGAAAGAAPKPGAPGSSATAGASPGPAPAAASPSPRPKPRPAPVAGAKPRPPPPGRRKGAGKKAEPAPAFGTLPDEG